MASGIRLSINDGILHGFVNPTVRDPPIDTACLSHVRHAATDLECTRNFFETGLGPEVTESSSTHLIFRAIEESGHHSLEFHRTAGTTSAKRIGMRVASEEDIDKAGHCFAAVGAPQRVG